MIRTEIKENVGVIYLDRPKQLNSLNLEMIRGIRENLEKWEEDENIRAVLFDSKSEKGFSAGGDLKEMYYDFLTNEDCTDKDQFFVEEFGLDKYINQFKKPIISHWYGIVMGGGIGLTINSDFIIADETVVWAMPETILGFVPDVGVCKCFTKLPQALGQYVGVLGGRLGTYDVIKHGLADISINSSDYDKLIDKLFVLSKSYEADELVEEFRKEASGFESEAQESDVQNNIEKIEKYFSHSSMKDIYESLKANENDDFAKSSLDEIEQRSAFVTTVQFEKYFICGDMTYEDVVDMDLELMRYSIAKGSIYEGIRAKMIDKDNKPEWKYKDYDIVPMDEVKNILGIDKTYSDRK